MAEILQLLGQEVILKNIVLTGLRGVGKTVLVQALKPAAISRGWLWAGADLSESASMNAERLAERLITDLSLVVAPLRAEEDDIPDQGDLKRQLAGQRLDYRHLHALYSGNIGLPEDRLKAVLEVAWRCLARAGHRGLVFVYDEAQNLADHAAEREYPLSMLLDVFQSMQRRSVRMMLLLAGLPPLFGKLVEARTFAERMFHVIPLHRLEPQASRDAILRPLEAAQAPFQFGDAAVSEIIHVSAGYPYFLQFMAHEVWDVLAQRSATDDPTTPLPIAEITRKLDTDFFAGRWARTTPRQRDLLRVAAAGKDPDGEFTVQEVVERAPRLLAKPFKPSHVTQTLSVLTDAGLVYKNRHGRYAFVQLPANW